MSVRFSKTTALLLGLPLAASIAFLATRAEAGEPAAKVILNGKAVPVFFNDGDSFRVLKGKMKGAKARLAGYNTLESHGAVHQWGDWTHKELYHVAKMATLHARRNVWECTTDGKTDTYGRMLVHCPGLREDMVRRGYAHAMSINDDPALPELVAAQKEAIANKRGIWAHGVPEYILTSLHSAEEDVEGRGTYNRLVSSADGHSIKWKHETKYNECANICLTVYPEEAALLPRVIERLQSEGATFVEGLDEKQLVEVLATYQRIRKIDRPVNKKYREDLQKLLDGYAQEGLFGTSQGSPGSCMVHVPFERRFGGSRAECLK